MSVLAALLVGCGGLQEDEAARFAIQFRAPTRYTLEKGDTRASVARKWGVTEEELVAWNPGFDALEPGAVILLHVPEGTVPKEAPKARPRPRPRRRCKPIRGQGDMVAARGLSRAEIQRAVERSFPKINRCLPGSYSGTYEMIVEIDVGCDGRVTNTYTLSPGVLPASVTRCVEKVFRSTRFPAHDMPDGMSFQYPLQFTR